MAIDLELAPKQKRPAGERCCEPVVYPDVEERGELAHAHLPGVLSQHVHQLKADGIAERLRDERQTIGLRALDIGVGDRLAARLTGRALVLRREL